MSEREVLIRPSDRRDVTDERRWTLSFYQAKAGVREITVTEGPCLAGNSTVEVVPASALEGAVSALRDTEDDRNRWRDSAITAEAKYDEAMTRLRDILGGR